MSSVPDPFAHHPELRDRIKDPHTSYFRDFDVKQAFASRPELHWVYELMHTAEQRDASRLPLLEAHEGDLWVFAYGSLMWDPAFIFDEVRRAVVADYERRFILKDVWGARGTLEAPGLMAALDRGDGCEGLVFRIARERIDVETEILWRREMVGPGYLPRFVTAQLGDETVRALTFVADYTADAMKPELTHDEQVAYCATGKGFLGTSHEYLRNIVDQFAALGVDDAHCTALLRDVEAFMQAHPATTTGPTT